MRERIQAALRLSLGSARDAVWIGRDGKVTPLWGQRENLEHM